MGYFCLINNISQSKIICKAYRELLTYIKRLPKSKINHYLSEAKKKMQENRELQDPKEISDALKELYSKIKFLKTITPRKPSDSERFGFESGHWVFREGIFIECKGQNKGKRVADGKISMEEAKTYHYKLLKRQYFGREPPKNPVGVF